MFTKSLVAAAALLSLAGAASAVAPSTTTTSLGAVTIGVPKTFSGYYGTAVSFEDFYTFVLPANGGSGYVVSDFGIPIPGFSTTISSLSVFSNVDGIVGNGDDAQLATDNTPAFSLPIAANGGGNFYVKVVGSTTGSSGGIYQGAISVSAIPEPGTYALMLAGLGAVGFVAARRRSRV